MPSRVDLHLHTTASDGALRPAELVRAAARIGIRVMAVTDHDSVDGIREAQDAASGLPIEVIPGIEVKRQSGWRRDPCVWATFSMRMTAACAKAFAGFRRPGSRKPGPWWRGWENWAARSSGSV